MYCVHHTHASAAVVIKNLLSTRNTRKLTIILHNSAINVNNFFMCNFHKKQVAITFFIRKCLYFHICDDQWILNPNFFCKKFTMRRFYATRCANVWRFIFFCPINTTSQNELTINERNEKISWISCILAIAW